MTTNTLIETELHQLFLSDGTEGAGRFKFMCYVETFEFNETRNFTERMVRDCNDPPAKPVRKSTPGAYVFNVPMTGHAAQSNAMYRTFKDAIRTGARIELQRKIDLSAANGGGADVFFAYVENFNESMPNEGVVTWTATVRGEDKPVWTAAA
ncbi:MAG: hypothetical protein FD152_3725 [Xanthobacteraceae bacterium]|nr:MAG: hypothetical protein FD152_3725 [Xanthobacteraceae bacterium]